MFAVTPRSSPVSLPPSWSGDASDLDLRQSESVTVSELLRYRLQGDGATKKAR
jgi:hypothetical protein